MDVLAGRYELGRPLGSGGMSRVVAAHDRVLGRQVAVKLLRDDLGGDPTIRERLLREARAAASFSHPNAVAIYDVGEDGGRPFIVMELVDGPSLADVVRLRGRLPVPEALRIADGMLAALGAAHDRALVHRDVKPSNILLADGSTVKLADFGIAKSLSDAAAALTATGQVIGTPGYLSPEQAAGRPADARSDVYAAGVVCYEMLSGAPPFTGTAVAVALAHQRDDPPALSAARPDAPAAVASVVHRALAKDPADRFASADELRQALHEALEGAALTHILPADAVVPGPAATSTTRGWAGPAAIVGTLAVLGVALLIGLAGEDGSTADGPGEPSGEQASVADAPAEAPAANPTPTATPPASEDLEALIESLFRGLREDEDRFGAKGEDLFEDLVDVEGERDRRKQAREARKLMDEIEKWIDEGELDPETGANALRILEDFLREQRQDA
jgi:eukaryotic-like serine/threonine-protein kinase